MYYLFHRMNYMFRPFSLAIFRLINEKLKFSFINLKMANEKRPKHVVDSM